MMYILLKDFYPFRIGDTLEPSLNSDYYKKTNDRHHQLLIPAVVVENNPDFFDTVEEKKINQSFNESEQDNAIFEDFKRRSRLAAIDAAIKRTPINVTHNVNVTISDAQEIYNWLIRV